MPTLIAGAVLPLLASAGVTAAVGAATASLIALGIGYAVTAVGIYAVTTLLNPKPEVPKPDDGKYNFKQSVPALTYALGRVRKGGDYVFLEEASGGAFHITVLASHRIQGIVQHYLHDEAVTLTGINVSSPAHFNGKVAIEHRLGEVPSPAYNNVITWFPSIWTTDHRGDGLATVLMAAFSVPSEDFQKTYPSGMPVHTAEFDGHAQIYDPRTGLYGFTTNLALHRLWHLTNPVGGKLTLDDMHLPDWSHAADVCDQDVTNRTGGTEKRYHGGFWFRADNDPVSVGFIMDQAAEMVVYERPDGKIGVHAGEFVLPDIRLTRADIVDLGLDPNLRRSSSITAVRGRYTNPAKSYSTDDAAIYGNPYETDDQRTKTVENQAVQKHNHMARLQKLAYLRSNAQRVTLTAHFAAAQQVPYRRFIRVHCPPQLDEAIIELTGRPVLSLTALTYRLEGLVVPPDLYAFDAATEEGAPGAPAVILPRADVPVPIGFAMSIVTQTSGGAAVKLGQATWTFANAAFVYELEWQPTAGGVAASVTSIAPNTSVRTTALADGVQYRFRLRTRSGGAASDWTAYIILTA